MELTLTINASLQDKLNLHAVASQSYRLPVMLLRDIEDVQIVNGALLVSASKRSNEQVDRIREFDPGIERAEWSLNKMVFDDYFPRRPMSLPLAWNVFWNSLHLIHNASRRFEQTRSLHFTFAFPQNQTMDGVRQHGSMTFHRESTSSVVDPRQLNNFRMHHMAYLIVD